MITKSRQFAFLLTLLCSIVALGAASLFCLWPSSSALAQEPGQNYRSYVLDPSEITATSKKDFEDAMFHAESDYRGTDNYFLLVRPGSSSPGELFF